METCDKNHISLEEIEHIAILAQIELSKKEKKIFREHFNKILDFFSKINEINTDNVSPTYHVLDLVNVYRKNKTKKTLSEKEIFKNAPKKEKGFFKSPRIVKKNILKR